MGVPSEGVYGVDETEVTARLGSMKPLRFTDHTVMMLVLAEHPAVTVPTGQEIEEDALMRRSLQAWRKDPRRGYGPDTRRLFAHVGRGVSWRETALSKPSASASWVDAMAAAPPGYLARSREHERDTLCLTPHHPRTQR